MIPVESSQTTPTPLNDEYNYIDELSNYLYALITRIVETVHTFFCARPTENLPPPAAPSPPPAPSPRIPNSLHPIYLDPCPSHRSSMTSHIRYLLTTTQTPEQAEQVYNTMMDFYTQLVRARIHSDIAVAVQNNSPQILIAAPLHALQTLRRTAPQIEQITLSSNNSFYFTTPPFIATQ